MYAISLGFNKIGDTVSQSGMYLCVPCGYMQYFEAGQNFTTCDACLAGTENGPENFREETAEFWQFIG
ncbi:MAG: hypothetical protein HYT37_04380 [Candidatus Sungbacteria bacterium]|nr:hypothetical protein [Candidatus Sungbacteria bacterium]